MADFTQNRSIFVRILFIAIPAIIVIRLLFLQVFDVGGYKDAALGQAIYMKKVSPPRGVVYDRKNHVLMNNSIVYDLVVEPIKIKSDFDTMYLCKLINVTIEDLRLQLKKIIIKNGWQKPSSLYRNLSPNSVARLQENLYEFSGIDLVEHAERKYTYDCGATVLGYINEINENQLKNEKYASYTKGDYLGINGLEKNYENELRGKAGVQYLLRDVKQRIQGAYKNGTLDSAATPGKALQLYLDGDLQKLTESMLANKLGSAIAIDPNTGGILAFASGPTFDPNLLTGSEKGKNLGKLLTDATKPLFNRAIQANYPPGSTFKPLTALVALDEGVITPSFGYPCHGGYYACGRRIGCTESWSGHAANLNLAIAHSCNAYFCHVLRLIIDAPINASPQVGLQRWHTYMNQFGLGNPIGIDIPYENGGNIPDTNYFNKVYNNSWNSCTMCIMGMGQGEVLLTPLQMANAMCIVANKGWFYIPHFVKAIGSDSTHPALRKYLIKHEATHISDSAFFAVQTGMEKVIEEGTGKIAKIPGIEVCGKTGTAQNNRIINGKLVKLQNHSLFVAFAPRINPKIAVAVCIENAGYGATWAGPIASLMIEQYLTDTISPKRQALVKKMKEAKIIPNYTYIIDSLEKEYAREKEAMKHLSKDSLLKLNHIKDSIKHSNDSLMARIIFNRIYGKHEE